MDEKPIPISKIAGDLNITEASIRTYADWSARLEGDEAVYPGGDLSAVSARIAGEIGYGVAAGVADQQLSTPVETPTIEISPLLLALSDAAVLAEAAQRALEVAYTRRDALIRKAFADSLQPSAIIRASRLKAARVYQIRNAGDEATPPR